MQILSSGAPRDFTEKPGESPYPEAAQRLMQGTKNGTCFHLCFSCTGCGAGRALSPPPAASLGAGVQTDPACCLAHCALAEFYGL